MKDKAVKIISEACPEWYGSSILRDVQEHPIRPILSTASLSKYTMQSLLSQICDVIIWYDVAMDILASR